MSNIKFTWKDPTVRDDGSPLDPSEIRGVEIFLKVGGSPDFTKIDTVAAGVQAYTLTDLPPGEYVLTNAVVDTQTPPGVSLQATPVTVTIEPPRKAAPAAATDLAATVE